MVTLGGKSGSSKVNTATPEDNAFAYAVALRASGSTDDQIATMLERHSLPAVDVGTLPAYRNKGDALREEIAVLERQPKRSLADESVILNRRLQLLAFLESVGSISDASQVQKSIYLTRKVITQQELAEAQAAGDERRVRLLQGRIVTLDEQIKQEGVGLQRNFGTMLESTTHAATIATPVQKRDALAIEAELRRHTQRSNDSQLSSEERAAVEERNLEASKAMILPEGDSTEYLTPPPRPTKDNPDPLPLEYAEHQKVAIKYALDRGGETGQKGTLIADPPGSGKTIMALGIANNLPTGPAERVLAVVPNSLKDQWQEESAKWLYNDMDIYVMQGQAKVPVFDENAKGMFIINYEQMRNPEVALQVGQTPWDMVILDESDAMINRTKQSKAIIGGEHKTPSGTVKFKPLQARFKLAMTGTPTDFLPVHLYNTLSYLDPDYWGEPDDSVARNRFVQRYTLRNTAGQPIGTKDEDHLQLRLRRNGMLLRDEKQILSTVPDPVRRAGLITSDSFTQAEKDAVEAEIDFAESLLATDARGEKPDVKRSRDRIPDDDETTEVKSKAKDNAVLGKLARIKRQTGEAKAPRVGKYVADAIKATQSEGGSKRPIIVFGWHRGVLDIIKDTLVKEGIDFNKIAHVDSKTPTKTRTNIFKEFKLDASAKKTPARYQVLLATMGVGGKGLNLQKADHIIFSELEWQPKQLTQAEHRAYRLKQDANVLIEHIILQNSLDGYIASRLFDKLSSVNQMLGGYDRNVLTQGSGDELISPEVAEKFAFIAEQSKKQSKGIRATPHDYEIFDWTPVMDEEGWEPAKKILAEIKGNPGRIRIRTTKRELEDGLHEPVKLAIVSDSHIKGDRKFRVFAYREDTDELTVIPKTYSSLSNAQAELDEYLPYYIEGNDTWDRYEVPNTPLQTIQPNTEKPQKQGGSSKESERVQINKAPAAEISDSEGIIPGFQHWQRSMPTLTEEEMKIRDARIEQQRKTQQTQGTLFEDKGSARCTAINIPKPDPSMAGRKKRQAKDPLKHEVQRTMFGKPRPR